ncbi:MAG: N-acetylmuramoyl-L-alanine amidase [Chloroflexi bacterium]|nr:N-acetylmuramoyl-L-alanine amidase [Chloroflexota bacterium]
MVWRMWGIWRPFLLILVLSVIFPVTVFAAREGVTTDTLRLRADMWGPIVDVFGPETPVEIYARSWAPDGTMWYYVGDSDGKTGWMFGDFVKTEPIYAHKVGLQVGHWRREEASYPFNASPGSSGGGLGEAEMNLITAKSVARHLSVRGVRVDLLPTVIPKGYKADAVVAIHADGGPSSRRGFFVDRPAQSRVAGLEAQLSNAIVKEYRSASDIPYVYRGTPNSQYYYGYYDVESSTPMVLIETGFLSNDADRRILIDRTEDTGAAITNGIMEFLNSH